MSLDRAARPRATRWGAPAQLAAFVAISPLLATAVILTVSRLADGSNPRALRIESFTPFGIPLYAAVLLASLAGLVLVPRTDAARTVWRVLAVVALLGLSLHLAWFSSRMVGPNPSPAPGATPLTVMSANVYAGNVEGADLVAAVIDEGADILVAVEVTDRELTQMAAAGIDDVMPYRIGGASDFDADGTMVFSRTPLGPATALGTGHESWSVEVAGLRLLAVHPYSPTVPSQWRADHRVVAEAADAEQPDLIVGDFNATLDHQPMQDLADAGWRSVAERTNDFWQPTWPNNGVIRLFGLPVPSLVQIDHVLIGRQLAAISVHTVDLPRSDHLAVVAQVARR